MTTHRSLPKIVGAVFSMATLSLSGCAGPSDSTESANADQPALRISAAASLQSVFEPLITQFEADNPDILIDPVNFDGSSTLIEQIMGGDRVDVFASADEANMDRLADAGFIVQPAKIFATNTITLAVPSDNPGHIENFADISNQGISVAVCAQDVPCGAATERLLTNQGLEIQPVTFEQNVSAVAAKIASGEVDAGFVYQTDVEASSGAITSVETPESPPNLYPAAVIRESTLRESAQKFVDFLASESAQAIFEEYGFGSP